MKNNKTSIFAIIILVATQLANAQNTSECCGGQPAPTAPKICCEDQSIDPTNIDKFSKSIDITAFADTVNKLAQELSGVVGKQGCEARMSGPASIGGSYETHKDCCDSKITKLQKVTAKANLKSGSLDCTYSLTQAWVPPQLASISVIFGFNTDLSVDISAIQTCDDTDACVTMTPSGNIYAGVAAYVGNDGWSVVKVTATGSGAVSGTFKYCVSNGFKKSAALSVTPAIEISMVLGGYYNVITYRKNFTTISV